MSCKGGYATWFNHQGNDPNILVGAIVGGPDHNDNFADARDNYEQTEPATYNNGPIVGSLARLQGGMLQTTIFSKVLLFYRMKLI